LGSYEKIVALQKFSEEGKDNQEISNLSDAMKKLHIQKDDFQKLKYESFIYELKNSNCKKELFLY